jgi:hypothetical protein
LVVGIDVKTAQPEARGIAVHVGALRVRSGERGTEGQAIAEAQPQECNQTANTKYLS